MSLADLIRKRANANPAKAANDGMVKVEPLARLATLSLANPKAETTQPAFVSGMVEILLPDRKREIATAIEEQAAEVIAAPLFGGGDRRLTIQTAETQYKGLECGGCVNLVMQAHVAIKGGRRLFQWTCKAGYRPLCAGYGLERVLVAPPECDRHESHTRPAGRH